MKKKTQQEETVKQEESSFEVEKPVSKGRKIANAVINWLLVIAIVIAAVCTYISFVNSSGNGVPSILGIRVFSVQTKSMYPTLDAGDLILSKGVADKSTLQVGDIITYWTVIDGERVLNTHRINNIFDGGGYRIFETRGDNNTTADPLTVHESEVVGRFAVRIPSVGKAFDYLQTSTGFLIVIVIPVFIFFLYYLVQFFRVLFEYQNLKNRLKYEQERGKAEDIIEAHERTAAEEKEAQRAALEAELREKLMAEIKASMASSAKPDEAEPKEEPKA